MAKQQKKILIVEDDAETRSQLALLIELLGYDTVTAANAAQALKIYTEQSADLVITDLVLPDRDGTELLGDLHRINSDLPVVILTGYPSPDTIIATLAENGYTYMAKPVQGEQIRAMLEKAFEE